MQSKLSPHDYSLPKFKLDTTSISTFLTLIESSADTYPDIVAPTDILEEAAMAIRMAFLMAVATGPHPTVILAVAEAMVVEGDLSVALVVTRCPS